jgi:quinol monooxygenase YgiN
VIHVIATITTAPGQRNELLAEFRRLVPAVRAEAGCIEYGPAVDLPTGLPLQAPSRDDVVMVVEKWTDVDALKAHLGAPHMTDYRERVKDLIRGVQLMVLQPA